MTTSHVLLLGFLTVIAPLSLLLGFGIAERKEKKAERNRLWDNRRATNYQSDAWTNQARKMGRRL